MVIASINLWSAMVKLADLYKEDPKKNIGIEEDADEVVKMCSAHVSFGTELSLTVNENGEWCVRIFNHENSDSIIELSVLTCGMVRVHRRMMRGDVCDDRSVTF